MANQKTELSIEELFDGFDIEAYFAAKKLRHDRPWVYDIIRVLWGRTSGIDLQQVYRDLWHIRNPSGLPIPKKFQETVRSAINSHTSQSRRWNGKEEDDLFYSPKGRGTWAVRRDKAAEWLKRHELPEA